MEKVKAVLKRQNTYRKGKVSFVSVKGLEVAEISEAELYGHSNEDKNRQRRARDCAGIIKALQTPHIDRSIAQIKQLRNFAAKFPFLSENKINVDEISSIADKLQYLYSPKGKYIVREG